MKRHIHFIILIITALCSCSDSEEEVIGSNNNKAQIEGDYIGTLNSEITNFEVSLEIRKIDENKYSVNLYESSNFRPFYNSDGITPEVKGVLNYDGTTYCARLNLKSDAPECTGIYEGCGSRNNQKGEFILKMTFDEICNGNSFDGEFTYTWIKIRNPN